MTGAEVACDESGYEGDHLVGGVTDVFAHAGVVVGPAAAAACVAELRARIGSPAVEYKANHLLRERSRGALTWLLGPGGPLAGNASVHLVDKALYAAARLVELLDDQSDAAAVHRTARQLAPARWTDLLAAFEAVLRTRRSAPPEVLAEQLRRAAAALGGVAGAPDLGALADRVAVAAGRLERHRSAYLTDPGAAPPLDPLLPAVAATVARWAGAGPVTVVHDRQTTLTAERVARLRATTALAGLRQAGARDDARVQLADFLAGVATRVASEVLAGQPDAELVDALAPYVDPASVLSRPGPP